MRLLLGLCQRQQCRRGPPRDNSGGWEMILQLGLWGRKKASHSAASEVISRQTALTSSSNNSRGTQRQLLSGSTKLAPPSPIHP